MPAKLLIDWNLAFDLFTRGLRFKEIAPQVGCSEPTLRKHAARHSWTQQVSNARQAVSEVVQAVAKQHHFSIAQRAERWIDNEATRVEKTSAALDNIPIPNKLPALREYVEVNAMHGKHGRSTFGLDQAGTSVTLNVGLVSRGDIMPVEQVIDVEPEPEQLSP